MEVPQNQNALHTPRPAWENHAIRIGFWLIILIIAADSFFVGLRLRTWMWNQTTNVRYWDAQRGYNWGSRAAAEGVINIYYNVAVDAPVNDAGETAYELDYLPLRMEMVKLWAQTIAKDPRWKDAYGWQSDFDFNAPMLHLNTIAEALSAIAVFLLVRFWYLRANPDRHFAAAIRGLIGGLLLWFGPAVLVDGYGWPQWDIWALPFFLFAVLLGWVEWWFCAGLLIGIGAMFKGQILLVTPALLLWPIFLGQFRAFLRMAIAIALAVAAITVPWTLRTPAAIVWISLVAMACGILVAGKYLARDWRWGYITAAAVATLAVALPIHTAGMRWMLLAVLTFASLAALFWLLPRRDWLPFFSAILAGATYLCTLLFNGSLICLQLGLVYGAQKFQAKLAGTNGTSNLASLLQQNWGWQVDDIVPLPWTIKHPEWITLRRVLTALFCAGLVYLGAAMAIQTRRRDPKFLIAMSATWLIMYAFLHQMHSRYLVWAAAATATMTAISVGFTLLHILIALLASSMMLYSVYGHARATDAFSINIITNGNASFAWLVVMCAAIFLYAAITRTPKRPLKL